MRQQEDLLLHHPSRADVWVQRIALQRCGGNRAAVRRAIDHLAVPSQHDALTALVIVDAFDWLGEKDRAKKAALHAESVAGSDKATWNWLADFDRRVADAERVVKAAAAGRWPMGGERLSSGQEVRGGFPIDASSVTLSHIVKRFPFMLVALILGAGSLAFLLAYSGNRAQTARNETASTISGSEAVANPESNDEDSRRKVALEPLSLQLEQLASELERPSGESERALVPALDARPRFGEEVVTLSPEALAAAVEVPNPESEQQATERAAQELEQHKATAARRADRAAKELNLNAGEAVQLADLYLAIGQRRRDTLAAMRARQVDHEMMKQTVQDLRTWRKDELTRQFGGELADRIEALDSKWGPGSELRRGDGRTSAVDPNGAGNNNRHNADN